MIQIDFFDKDLISTLVPVFTMEPDTLFFIIDNRESRARAKENIVRALKNRLPDLQIHFFDVQIDDLQNIFQCLQSLPLEREQEIVMDFTGGTELMTACGYSFCKEKNITPIYVDVLMERVINIDTQEPLREVVHIELDDYLKALGADRLEESHGTIPPEDYTSILKMARYIFQNLKSWDALHKLLMNPNVTFRGTQRTAVIPAEYFESLKYLDVRELMNQFEEEGFWRKKEGSQRTYEYRNEQCMHFMTTYGVWLELFIYVQARMAFGDDNFADIGVVIDWNDQDAYETTDNEIDVLILRKSIPIVISCKMTRPTSENLYEVGYLASLIGGKHAVPVIATTYNLRSKANTPTSMLNRFQKMKIGLIQVNDFEHHDPSQVFLRALEVVRD